MPAISHIFPAILLSFHYRDSVRVCVLTTVLDAFKGGNHLPLFAALPDIQWTILTNRTKPAQPVLPANVRVQTLGSRLGPYYYGIADYRFAHAVLRRFPPRDPFWQQFDVLHCNQTMGLPLLRLRESGRPLLYLVHHPVSVDRTIALEESGGFEALRWRLKYALLCRWQRILCREMPMVATVSETVAQRTACDYGRKREDIAVIPNGIDDDLFSCRNLQQCDFDIIAVGSLLHPRKGFPYLLRAYRMLAQRGLRIADVGRRSDEQRRLLAAIAAVQVWGMVDHDQLVSLLQRSATLISTSLYEGFGLSLIEALSCGRPAFAFDAGGAGEILRSIDPQLVVPLRDVDALVERVYAYRTLPADERAARGLTYRAEVAARYPLRSSAALLRRLYESIIR
jgi:glycosyltransferase involved in cell wall biosynthesis